MTVRLLKQPAVLSASLNHPSHQFSVTCATPLLQVYGGSLPAQLGSLSRLKIIVIQHYCLTGPLPPFLLRGLPDLNVLDVSRELGRTYVSPTGEQCGVSGPVPAQWQSTKSQISFLKLAYNR